MNKKRIVIGAGILCILVWSTVLMVYLRTSSPSYFVTEHSYSTLSDNLLKEESSSNEDRKSTSLSAKNIIGSGTLSEAWREDVEADGKLSIDTLLETLNIDE